MDNTRWVSQPQKLFPVTGEYDVVVAGGGIAGVAAALAAARQGASVVLLESNCLLGGLATLGLITVYEPLCDGHGNQVIFGMAEELLRLSIRNGAENRYPDAWLDGNDPERLEKRKSQRFAVQFNAQFFALDMEQQLLEHGVKILYRTKVFDTVVRDGRITEVLTDSKAGRQAIAAKAFVDATGDADLCWFSGEATAAYKKNQLTAWYYYCDNTAGYHVATRRPANQTVFYNGLSDETDMVLRAHRMIYEDILRKKTENPTVVPATLPVLPQFLMTRRLAGVTQPTLVQAEQGFADAIGRMGNWRRPAGVYDIPYSSLYGRRIGNLITAGRCVSHQEDLWDISRVIPVCALTGEAAGAAAAMAAGSGQSMDRIPLEELRKRIGYRERNLT